MIRVFAWVFVVLCVMDLVSWVATGRASGLIHNLLDSFRVTVAVPIVGRVLGWW